MGQPVVHFEVIGKDGEKLRSYYSELFGWEIDANNPMRYGIVQREGNVSPAGVGIGGGIAGGPDGYGGHVTFSRYLTSRPGSRRRNASAARGCSVPTRSRATSRSASSPILKAT